jgi:hypothetical protein
MTNASRRIGIWPSNTAEIPFVLRQAKPSEVEGQQRALFGPIISAANQRR